MKLINVANVKRIIYLFLRDDKGNLEIREDKTFFPYYYENDSDGKFKSYTGESLRKVFVSNPSDVPKQRTNNAWEADIIFTKRYLIDKVEKLEKCPVKYAFIDIEVLTEALPNVKEASLPISSISVYNSFTKEIKTFYLGDITKEHLVLEEENQLLQDFIDYMKVEKFDLWLSWHVGFDYNYVYNRYAKMCNTKKYNDFGKEISPINQSRYGDGDVYYPAGISIVDYLGWDKKITLNRRKSYALDNVLKEEFGIERTKVDFSKLSPELKKKNIEDVQYMAKLEEKFKYIDYVDEIRRLTKIEWEDIIWNSRIIDMLLLQEAKDKNVALPMKPAEDRGTLTEKEEYAGAYREAFKTGRFETVGVYDLASAYPSMIIDFCLDPNNICNVPLDSKVIEGDLRIEGTVFRQNPDALLPIVVKKIMDIKSNIKSELSKCPLNSEQHKKTKVKYDAIKSVVNSAYGVFGLRFFRLFQKEVASATTFLVRDLLHYVQEKLEKQGHEIIYIDTDSIMINNNSDDINDTLNEYVKQWAEEKYGKTVDIEFEYKGYFNPIIILAKCRYKGWLKTDKGTEPKTKGIEAKRKDSTVYMKKFQTELLDKIKNEESKEDIFGWIKGEIKQLPNQQLKDIAFPCRLSKQPEKYKNLPIFVRAMNNTPGFKKRVGENFYYIFVKPEESNELKTVIKIIPTEDISYETIELDENLTRKEGIEYARKEFNEPELDSKRIKVLHQRPKPKNVVAFDEETAKNTKNVDWDMIIKRNIMMKLDTIFEAMKWDIGKIGYQPPLETAQIKTKAPQIKPKRTKSIERPQEPKKDVLKFKKLKPKLKKLKILN